MVTRPTLEKRIQQLDAMVRGEFNGELPNEELPKWVPHSEQGKQDLFQRMMQASDVLADRIEKNSKRPSDKRKDPEKIKVSLSDPVAPLGRDKLKVYRPLYTVQYVVAPTSYLIMSYCCEAAVTDVGTLAPMIDKTQQATGGRLKKMMADAAYCSIVDLKDCQQRNVELLAPVQSNSFTKSKKKSDTKKQIPRDEFEWNEELQCYRCPKGHVLRYHGRERKQRHSGHELWENRYRCAPDICSTCPLVTECLRPGSSCRMIKRLEGQELLDAQREKMETSNVQALYKLRSQTVELAFADSKGNRRRTRFHGRGIDRVRAETGIMVLAQNLLRLDRLEENQINTENNRT